MSNLFIPAKIRVGFQKRSDTFTGKLAYIIYYDANGEIKQEKSWNKWRDQKIDYVEFDNVPRSGFILNKGVSRQGYWGSGRSVIRVYDSRDFEFEISVDNLIGILMHSDVSKRDITQECVFAWSGNHVVLLPTNSDEYTQGLEHTAKQAQNIDAKELVPGRTYSHKKDGKNYVYLGYHEFFEKYYFNSTPVRKGKQHVFHDGKSFVSVNPDKLASCINSESTAELANLVSTFLASPAGQDPGKFTYGVLRSEAQTYVKNHSGSIMAVQRPATEAGINIDELKFMVCRESYGTRKLEKSSDHYDKMYLQQFSQEEKRAFTHWCASHQVNPQAMTFAQFLEMLKQRDFQSIYFVDGNKVKTML